MSLGDREEWSKLLPIIQAFVDGRPVQKFDYDKRWKDTNSIYQLRCGQFRVKPDDLITGVWSQDYEYREPGAVQPPIGKGTFTWTGTNKDTPPFKNGNGFTFVGKPAFKKEKP